MRTCRTCKTAKPDTGFGKNARIKDGLNTRCKECDQQANRNWRAKDPERTRKLAREAKRNWLYGVSTQQFEAMLAAQDQCCALCRRHRSELPREFHVDHDHRTGKVRALLCSQCNTALGLLQDDPTLMERAAAYIRYHAS